MAYGPAIQKRYATEHEDFVWRKFFLNVKYVTWIYTYYISMLLKICFILSDQ